MDHFKNLNWEHFKGKIDVEHFMGFLQYLVEEETQLTKDELIEMVISNIGSHIEK